jgi:hypothetical protein
MNNFVVYTGGYVRIEICVSTMGWSRMQYTRNAQQILVEKPAGKWQLGRPRR